MSKLVFKCPHCGSQDDRLLYRLKRKDSGYFSNLLSFINKKAEKRGYLPVTSRVDEYKFGCPNCGRVLNKKELSKYIETTIRK